MRTPPRSQRPALSVACSSRIASLAGYRSNIFEVMFGSGLVDEIVTVSEEEIASAVALAWIRLHLALEPTGALPLAAYVAGKLRAGRTGLIFTGGNANLETVATLLTQP